MMNAVNWTRIYEDAVGREVDIIIPSCPPQREAVLETSPNFVELIQVAVENLRRTYRMHSTAEIIITLPRWRERYLTDVDRALILEGRAYIEWVD